MRGETYEKFSQTVRVQNLSILQHFLNDLTKRKLNRKVRYTFCFNVCWLTAKQFKANHLPNKLKHKTGKVNMKKKV